MPADKSSKNIVSRRFDSLEKLKLEQSRKELNFKVTVSESSLSTAQKIFRRVPTLVKLTPREIGVAVISVILTLFLSQVIWERVLAENTITIAGKSLSEVTNGTVALTEEDLKRAVQLLGATVYWSGPEQNYKYTIENQKNGQIFVKYLPNGQGALDSKPVYRVIATYELENAFNSTKAAGALASGIGLTSPDGAAVYYDRNAITNVYLAFDEEDYQVEIFDPGAGVSVALAIEFGRVKKI